VRILSMPVDDGGCGHYRVRQPLAMIKKYTDHDCHLIDIEKDDMLAIAAGLPFADIVLCRQGSSISQARAWLENASLDYGKTMKRDGKMGAKWVMDIDDNREYTSPYSQHYRDNGLEEYFDRNRGVWLWKDGQRGFDLKKNREQIAEYFKDMASMDLVIVATEKLKEHVLPHNKNVVVIPNSIDFTHWWQLPLQPSKQLRVGWSGGASHYEDWYAIKKPLNKLLRKYRFTLVVAGSDFTRVIDPDLRDLVEIHDWLPFEAHSYRMMCLNLDFAIIPLAKLPFNYYKSSVKWYEMSAMGCPTVAARVLPYSAEIEHNQTGLMYSSPSQFEKAVLSLIESPVLKKQLAENAQKWVFEHRNAEINTKLYINTFQSLLEPSL
jgi:glycosyltransferase involved in cell wall biosynthesis